MIISEKQIMQLIHIAQRYQHLCSQYDWIEDGTYTHELLTEISYQQSEELKEVK